MKTMAVCFVVAALLCASADALAREPIPTIRPPAEKKAPDPVPPAAAPAAAAGADVVELMDGSTFNGTVLFQDAQSVGFRTGAGEKFIFPMSSIASLRHADGTSITPPAAPSIPVEKTAAPETPGAVDAPGVQPPFTPARPKKKRMPAQEQIGVYPKPPAEQQPLPQIIDPVARAHMQYDDRSVNPTVALVLEFFPGLGVGNFYARNYGWGVLELASYGMLIAGLVGVSDNPAQAWVFVSAACAVKIGAIVMAPIGAMDYNDRLKKELKLTLPGERDLQVTRGLALGFEF